MNIVKFNKFWLFFFVALIWFSLVAMFVSYKFYDLGEEHSNIKSVGLKLERCIADEQLKMHDNKPTQAMIQSFFGHGICVRKISTEALENPEALQKLFSELRVEFPSKQGLSEEEFTSHLLNILEQERKNNETRLKSQHNELKNSILINAVLFAVSIPLTCCIAAYFMRTRIQRKLGKSIAALSGTIKICASFSIVWIAYVLLRTNIQFEFLGVDYERWNVSMFWINSIIPVVIVWSLYWVITKMIRGN